MYLLAFSFQELYIFYTLRSRSLSLNKPLTRTCGEAFCIEIEVRKVSVIVCWRLSVPPYKIRVHVLHHFLYQLLTQGCTYNKCGSLLTSLVLFPQANNPSEPCQLPNGKPGVCRQMQHCMQEEFKKDFIKFADYLCIIDNS